MRKLVLSALILSAYPLVIFGQEFTDGEWTYIVENDGATITASTATGAVTIPSQLGGYAVKKVGYGGSSLLGIFGSGNRTTTSVVIPSTVTSIASWAFTYCTALTSVTLPNSLTRIEGSAFSFCTALTNITIPSSVTSIEGWVFEGCTALANITIPSSVTSIGSGPFFRCSALSSVTLPISVTSIPSYAFYGCTALTNITLPISVTSIGNWAFEGCASLASITIPNNVTSIGYDAFRNCTSLVAVYLPARFANTYANFGLTPSQANFGISLTASCDTAKGTILVNPNKLSYEAGESVVVTATSLAGYLFSNWSGASTATTSSITLTMNATKSVTASFNQDGRDNDGDGLTNYQESITYGTNPNVAETASPVAGLYLASQMQAMAIGDLVLTKNANGSFDLNYDIEKSTDLQSWLPYQSFKLTLTNLPPDKAFIRIKAKQ
jgi:hypothetical protein